MGLVKYQPPKAADQQREDYIAAMYLLYLRCPGRDTRDASGVLDLGEIGETKSDRGIYRWCPYAPAGGLKP